MNIDLTKTNQQLQNSTPQEIVSWATKIEKESILVSSNFNPYEAAILQMVSKANPSITTLWIDTGFNTKYTYRFALDLIEQLNLNVTIYNPKRSAALIEEAFRGIPPIEDKEKHDKFTEEVKLEPFRRAFNELKPKVWLTALRKDQTDFRKNMDVISMTKDGILKICPLLNWNKKEVTKYIKENNLPLEERYFDPTKILDNRECGLHPNF